MAPACRSRGLQKIGDAMPEQNLSQLGEIDAVERRRASLGA
jgi:hypothetical protein